MRNGCRSQAGFSSSRSDERGARSTRFLPVFMLPSLWVLIWVSHSPWIPTLGGRILRDGIFELKPRRWEFSPRKRFSGRRISRCISRCQCPRGRQLGFVLEELTGAGGGGHERGESRAGCRGWKGPDHAGPLCHSRAFQVFISTLKTIKEFKQRHVLKIPQAVLGKIGCQQPQEGNK